MRPLLALLAVAGLSAGASQAASIKLRPQGEALTRAVQLALSQLSTPDIPMTLDTTSGPTLTIGGVGLSDAPFNPDVAARVVQVGSERRLEFNPRGPLPLDEAVRQELLSELKLKTWTPAAAQARYGGADLNGDGVIDLADLALLMANYDVARPAVGDLNGDGRVNDTDVRMFSVQYQIQDAPIPEDAPAPDTAASASPAVTPTVTPAVTPTVTPTPATATPPAPTSPAATPATPTPAKP